MRRCMLQSWQGYNRAAHSGDDPLGKSHDLLHPLEAPPFYALDISVDKRVFPCAALTLGGLRVNETDGAVRTAGGTVPGLYAAGRAAVGMHRITM